MMSKELIALINTLESEEGKNWINSFTDLENSAEIISKAKQLGISVSNVLAEELKVFIIKVNKEELSEEELDSISAGWGENPKGELCGTIATSIIIS